MRDGEPNQYTGLCNLYTALDQVQRGRLMTAYFLVNGGALPVIFGTQVSPTLKLVLSAIVFVLHAAWYAAALRSHNMLVTVGEKLAELERVGGEEGDATRVKFFDDPAITPRRVGRFAQLGRLSPFTAGGILWLGLLVRQITATL